MKLFLIMVAFVLPGSSGNAQPSTDSCDRGGMLSAAGIGPLRIGLTIDSLAKVCRIVDSVRDAGSTRYRVRIGADTTDVYEAGGRVFSISTGSPVHRTRDSLGVGSPVERLLDLPDLHGVGFWPEAFVVHAQSGEHCGLGFWLDAKTAAAVSGVEGGIRRALGMRGAGGVVASIEIRGACTTKEPT